MDYYSAVRDGKQRTVQVPARFKMRLFHVGKSIREYLEGYGYTEVKWVRRDPPTDTPKEI